MKGKNARAQTIDRNELTIDNIWEAYFSVSLCMLARVCFHLVDNGNCMNSRRHLLYIDTERLLLTMELILVLNSNLTRKSKIKWQWPFECFLSVLIEMLERSNGDENDDECVRIYRMKTRNR